MSFIPAGPEPEWLARMQDTSDALLETTGQTARLVLDLYAATLDAIAAGQRQVAAEADVPWIADVVETQAGFTEGCARAAAWARQQLP